jgi:Cu-processing system ATP-binding protein
MIRMRGLTKRFGALPVLRGVDLEIARGQVTAIVGPNGAGKTTLIKIMLGLTRADGGTLTVDGMSVDADPAYRARIGYMPQIARFPQHLTGGELLAMLRDLRGTATVDGELIERFALHGELAKPLRTLSGGNKQKVNAAMAFLFGPDAIVLDEPTAGLDPVSSGILKDKVRQGRDRGQTFILTTHVMSEIDELADDVVLLLDGRVAFAGPIHDLKRSTRELSVERAIAQLMLQKEAA